MRECSVDGSLAIGLLMFASFIALFGGALSKSADSRKGAWVAGFGVAGFVFLGWIATNC
jgi:hypothetical protein